jgi:hypothetical protein
MQKKQDTVTAEVGNLFLNVATGMANEKWNLPHHVKTKKLGCSTENLKKYENTLFEQVFSIHVNFDYWVTTAIRCK